MILVEICLHCLQVFHHFHFLIIIIIIIITTMTVFYHLQLIYIFHIQVASQETFILMKTSSRRLDQDEYIHLDLQDFFKISSRGLQDFFPRRDVFKTSLIRLQDVFKSLKRLQDIFMICSHIIKLNCSC